MFQFQDEAGPCRAGASSKQRETVCEKIGVGHSAINYSGTEHGYRMVARNYMSGQLHRPRVHQH